MHDESSRDPLMDLLLRWEECRREGREVSAEALCADCPEHTNELLRRIDILLAMDGLLGDEDDPPPLGEDSPLTSGPVNGQVQGRGQNGDTDADRADSASRSPRYRRSRLLAQGGLGDIFVARDTELNRDVALKEIRGCSASDPASRERFLTEAEVTGNLEHPGIVPVYGLGSYPDERPYYAMRLIQGEHLKKAINRFHRTVMSPGERARSLHGLLRRYLGVCDAVAYAHSRGVIHRDLKPRNIMLGKYGETMVVDWGLAKCLGGTDSAWSGVEDPLHPPHAGAGAVNDSSAASGTPAYMSPEQAQGKSQSIGPASDIYSLGATLYTLLTGQAPFQGSIPAILRDVQCGNFPTPRALRPDIPRGLEAACLKAMALKPEDRYTRVQDLSDDVERWLAGEPVSAYPEPWPVRLRRGLNRHRTVVAAASAMIVITTISLFAITLLLADANRRERTLRTSAQGERDRAELAQGRALAEADRARGEARKSRMLSDFLVGLFQSSDPLGLEGHGFREPSESVRDLTSVQLLRRGAERLQGLKQSEAVDQTATAVLMDAIGNSLRSLGDIEHARNLLDGALTLHRTSNRTDDAELAANLFHLGLLEHDTHEIEAAERHYREAARLYARAGGENGASVTNVRFRLAWLLGETKRFGEAETMFSDILREREARLGAGHPEVHIVRLALLVVLAGRSDPMAVAKQAKSLLSQDNLLANAVMIYLQAMAMRRLHSYPLAANLYEKALTVFRRQLPPQHPLLAMLLGDMAGLYREMGDLGSAETLIREALEIGRRTIPLHPAMIEGLTSLADEMFRQKRFDEAERLYIEAIEIARRRRRIAGEEGQWKQILERLVRAEHDRGRLAQETLYREMFHGEK